MIGINAQNATHAITFCESSGSQVFSVDSDGTIEGDVDAAIAIPDLQACSPYVIPLLRAIKRLQERTM